MPANCKLKEKTRIHEIKRKFRDESQEFGVKAGVLLALYTNLHQEMPVLDQEKALLAASEGLSGIYYQAGTAPPRTRIDRVLFNSIFVLSIGTLLSTAWGLAYVYSGLDWNAKEVKATKIGDLGE